MAKAYQYDASGYYVGEVDDHGGPLPNNATRTAPPGMDGHIPRWNGTAWEQVENHKGEQGYVDGEPHTIKEYGPLPEGWSATPPEPTPEEQRAAMQAAFTAAIQEHLDAFARTRNYDGILSAATYATSTVPKFAAEGQYAVEARDATWATGYEILDQVLSGTRPLPTVEEVIAGLPPLAWPGEAASGSGGAWQ